MAKLRGTFFESYPFNGGGGNGVDVVWMETGFCCIFCNNCGGSVGGGRELYSRSSVSISNVKRLDDKPLDGKLTAAVGRTVWLVTGAGCLKAVFGRNSLFNSKTRSSRISFPFTSPCSFHSTPTDFDSGDNWTTLAKWIRPSDRLILIDVDTWIKPNIGSTVVDIIQCLCIKKIRSIDLKNR